MLNSIFILIAATTLGVTWPVPGDDSSKSSAVRSNGDSLPRTESSVDPEPTPSVNLRRFAADVVRGRANVTVIGDSINNDGQSGFMFSGYLLEWRPIRWRQVNPPINANGIATGSWLETSGSANYELIRPGQSSLHMPEFAGTHLRNIRTIRGNGWTGRAISTGFNFTSLGFEDGMLREAGAERNFLRNTGPYRHRLLLLGDDDPETRNRWEIRSRNTEPGTTWTESTGSIEFTGPSQPGLRWFDHQIEGSWRGMGHHGSGIYSSGGPFGPDTRVGLGGVVITDLGTPTGLGLTYVGQGGWRSENHRYPYGSNLAPLINGPWGTYPAGYSNDAVERHMKAHETSHVMIWIGSNNSGVDSAFPSRTAADVQKIIERYRAVHQGLQDQDGDLEPLKFLVVSPYTFNDSEFFKGYADLLRELAGDDVAFVDLHGLVRDSLGSYDLWNSQLLTDGVHPNLDGARTFAAMIWNELVKSVGPSADLDRDGIVDAADFGVLLNDWGNVGHPGPADLDRNGRVDGDDLGLLLLQWGALAD
jgi:lysophospholipase L1-like esterase